jgi:hypothetical protein
VSLQIKKSADSKQTKSANKKLNKKNQNVLKFEGKWRLNMERRGP